MRRIRPGIQFGVAATAIAVLCFTVEAYAGCGDCGPKHTHEKSASPAKAETSGCPLSGKTSCTAKQAAKKAGPCCGTCGGQAAKPAGCPLSSKSGCSARKASACCGTCGGQAAAPAESATISTAALTVLLRSKAPVVVLDARTGRYDDGKRIPGATALSPKADANQVAKRLPSKDALIVTYCAHVKCPASKSLAGRLRQAGYTNILEYSEGMAGWLAAKQPIEAHAHPKCVTKLEAALKTGDFTPVGKCAKTRAALEAITLAKADFHPKCRAKVMAAVKSGQFDSVGACKTTRGEVAKALDAYKASQTKAKTGAPAAK